MKHGEFYYTFREVGLKGPFKFDENANIHEGACIPGNAKTIGLAAQGFDIMMSCFTVPNDKEFAECIGDVMSIERINARIAKDNAGESLALYSLKTYRDEILKAV